MTTLLETVQNTCESMPDYVQFVDEPTHHERSIALRDKYPDTVRLQGIGKTAAGRNIEMLTVGSVKKTDNARCLLLKGLVHPNEAVSTLTTDFLSEQFAQSDLLQTLGYDKALIIKVADGDGYAMQGWVGEPFTAETYLNGFYRPPGNRQVDAGYPYHYKRFDCPKGLPESMAVAQVIETHKIDYMAALHNSALGRPYLYTKRQSDPFASMVGAWMERYGLTPRVGAVEIPHVIQWAPGLYEAFSVKQRYDALVAEGEDPLKHLHKGVSSGEFLAGKQSHALHQTTELPYFNCAALDNDSPSGLSTAETIRAGKIRRMHSLTLIKDSLAILGQDDHIAEHPLFVATQYQHGLINAALNIQRPGNDTEATTSQAFGAQYIGNFYSLGQFGQLSRLARIAGRDALADSLQTRISDGLAEMSAAGGAIETIPLREQAIAQAGLVLIGAGLSSR